MTADPADPLPAGGYATWLSGMERALRGEADADVPCAGCTACCTSSQFIHIEPDETGTLSRIPVDLLFPAPGLPAGHMLLGYDERGHCPMLTEGACSIYEDRPRTCRSYDCRVFPASGLELDEGELPEIAARARRWQFDFSGEEDRRRSRAVRSAAEFIRTHGGGPSEPVVPRNTTQLAVLAVRAHEDFLEQARAPGSATEPGP